VGDLQQTLQSAIEIARVTEVWYSLHTYLIKTYNLYLLKMHTAFDQIEPIFNQFKNRANVEIEMRLGKISSGKFDTNVGKVVFNKILKGLENYKEWEKVEKSNTTVYFSGDIRVIDDDATGVSSAHKKTKLKKTDLRLEGKPYDLRFSIATEVSCPKPGENTEYDDMRVRKRVSFVRKNLSIDMTIVRGDADDPDSEEDERYEIELEIIKPQNVKDKNELYNIIHKVDDILKLLAN